MRGTRACGYLGTDTDVSPTCNEHGITFTDGANSVYTSITHPLHIHYTSITHPLHIHYTSITHPPNIKYPLYVRDGYQVAGAHCLSTWSFQWSTASWMLGLEARCIHRQAYPIRVSKHTIAYIHSVYSIHTICTIHSIRTIYLPYIAYIPCIWGACAIPLPWHLYRWIKAYRQSRFDIIYAAIRSMYAHICYM